MWIKGTNEKMAIFSLFTPKMIDSEDFIIIIIKFTVL